MHLYRSNRVETLAECLAELCAEPLASPFSRECIVVQSKGMATWLAMQLADRFGVWANPDFPHPRQFVQRLLVATLGEQAAHSADFTRDKLTLAVLAELPALLAQPEFAPIARYFATGHDDLKWLQLAEKIAQVFDQYAVFRPEMVLAWEAGGGASAPQEEWQPILWRAITGRIVSPAQLFLAAFDRLREGHFTDRAALPDRLLLFGITTLPPVYLSLLAELAHHLPVHLLLFSPATEYWGETATTKAVGRLLRDSAGVVQPSEMHLDTSHPLLASFGTLGRDFQVLLEERVAGAVEADNDLFAAHGNPQNLLHLLQDDILQLRHRHAGALEAECQPVPLADADDSLIIHCCHSPLREVEVLQDQLLAMLGQPGLRPRDIAVMVPDIETYAPFIEAVFDRDATDPRYIPFRIADRAMSREAPLIEAFFTLLALLPGRLTAPQVLDLLAFTPVRERFGIAAEELPRLERWSVEAGIRWGIDEAARSRHGQPAARQNTWGFGFDRLLLGYALPLDEKSCWHGVLPYEQLEGQDADLLGRFLTYGDTLFAWADQSGDALPLAAWQERMAALLAAIFRNGPDEGWQHHKILDAAAALAADGARVGNDRPLTLPAYARLLRARLESEYGDHGFLQGGVTFCAMLPMRSIPFAVICLLGLDDGAFPRLQHALSFDLVARNPMRGDRSRRNDDRYLFLEALLAARQRLYLSYVGRSSRDNAGLPPSVVVDELLDCLADGCVLPGEETGAPGAVQHPLQPFSPRYFDRSDPRLFSFAPEYYHAAQVGCSPGAEQPPFVAAPLTSPAEADGVVTLPEMQRFFKNPAKFFCRERLDLLLHDVAETIPDREPLILDALERHTVGRQLLAQPGAVILPEVAALLQAKGILPSGGAGPAILQDIWQQVALVRAGQVLEQRGATPATLVIDLPLPGNLRLAGEVAQYYGWGLLRVRPGKLNPSFKLACWLDHLAVCAMLPEQAIETVMVGRNDKDEEMVAVARYRPVAGAAALLAEVAAVRVAGTTRPQPFFPQAAHAYAQAVANGKGSEAARRAAWSTFTQKAYNGGPSPERDDPYVQKVFGPDPLDDHALATEFGTLALQLFGPLLDHLGESA